MQLKADNSFFCAKRIWNQKAEDDGTKIEKEFHIIADAICNKQIKTLSNSMHLLITEMYLLWRSRCFYATNPVSDHHVKSLADSKKLTKDKQEILEKNG